MTINISIFETWFNDYTSDVLTRCAPSVKHMAEMKIAHTYRVQRHAVNIARGLGFCAYDVCLASIIGLFHDLGRFRQVIEFETMSDRITGSHADMSADIFETDAPKTGLTPKEVQIITDALKYHNLLAIPEGVDKKTLLFSQLIRDADKLDILDLFSDWENNKKFLYLGTAEGKATPELMDMVMQGKNFDNKLVKNANDCRLLYISMIFDINFAPAFEWILENDILTKITAGEDEMEKVAEYVTDWVINQQKICAAPSTRG